MFATLDEYLKHMDYVGLWAAKFYETTSFATVLHHQLALDGRLQLARIV
jgi:hypothetical protein